MTEEFAAAGEFYGHLLRALAFGDLTMRHEERCFVYQWYVKINSKPLAAEVRVSSAELRQARFLDNLAQVFAAKWMKEIRKLQR